MIRRFFSTTLGQILVIITTASAITFLFFTLVLVYREAPPMPPWPWNTAYRIASMVNMLQDMSENQQAAVIATTQKPNFSVIITDAPGICPRLSLDTRDLESALQTMLQSSQVVSRTCGDAMEPKNIQVIVPLGTRFLDIRTGLSEPLPHRMSRPFRTALLFMCIAIVAMSAWAAWRVIRPLRHLSEQADAFGKSIAISPLKEEGPLEIRCVTRAFNLMQQRIARFFQDRTRMLAAIGHDLRTPLTRMKLQLETGNPTETREKLLRDVGVMQSMVDSALAFLSGAFDGEEAEWLDLGALLATLCDEYRDSGVSVCYEGPEQIRFYCKPNAICRMMTNLIDNGTYYGSNVVVTALVEQGRIVVEVLDDGPGIPQENIQEVVDPFVQLDHTRSKRPGSVGLGLSIVKEIAEAHRGRLELGNREGGGLAAVVSFHTEYPARPAGL